jgi:hypothetical protein
MCASTGTEATVEAELLDAVEMPREDEAVVSPLAYGSPFAGITLAQARILNSALAGLPVEVYGGARASGPEVYIFAGMVLPSPSGRSFGPSWMLFAAVGDLVLDHAERLPDGGWASRGGSSRILSAALVRRFDVLAIEPTYRVCETCGRRMGLTEKVFDQACLGNEKLPAGTYGHEHGEFEWSHWIECRACWHGEGF